MQTLIFVKHKNIKAKNFIQNKIDASLKVKSFYYHFYKDVGKKYACVERLNVLKKSCNSKYLTN